MQNLTDKLPIPIQIPNTTGVPENIKEYYGVEDAKYVNDNSLPKTKFLLGGVAFQAYEPTITRLNTDGYTGLELFLQDNMALITDADKLRNFGSIPDLDDLGSYDNSFSLSINYVTKLAFNYSPEKSWVKYRCDLTTVIENHVITHTLLPKQDLNPQSVPEATNTEFESNINETIPFGPDQLIGERKRSLKWFVEPSEDKEIQICGTPDTRIIIKGEAQRAKYEIIPPVLLRYGGKRCYQTKNIVTREQIGSDGAGNPLNSCKWELHYVLRNVPTGFLGTPTNPLLWDFSDNDTLQFNPTKGILYTGVLDDNTQIDLMLPERYDGTSDKPTLGALNGI